jgi:hypothetical protein
MNRSRCVYLIILPLVLSILLTGCDQMLAQVLPPPTETPTATLTSTYTATATEIPTATFTLPPSATVTASPTFAFSATPFGAPTFTLPAPAAATKAGVEPIADAKFRGKFSAGTIVFSTNEDGDAVKNMRVTFKCFGEEQVLDLSQASMKITNGSFAYGTGEYLVQGRFITTTSATGIFNLDMVIGNKTCKHNYVPWQADLK